MNKLFYFLLLVLPFASCKKDIVTLPVESQTEPSTETSTEFASRLLPGEKVKLYKAWSSNAWAYHGVYIIKRHFYVEVEGTDSTQKVVVHHKMQDGTWKNFPLKFQRKAGNNEIFYLELDLSTSYTTTPPKLGNEFAIRYTENGQTYWDNNNSQNYTMNPTEGMWMQYGVNVSADTYKGATYFVQYNGSTSAVLNVVADVRNIDYVKKVELVYTTNNWATVKKVPLLFRLAYGIGGGTALYSPNRFNIERWSVNMPVTGNVKNIKYAISYEVAGQTFWDNNFGKNYTLPKEVQ